jgi:hypothetical protein
MIAFLKASNNVVSMYSRLFDIQAVTTAQVADPDNGTEREKEDAEGRDLFPRKLYHAMQHDLAQGSPQCRAPP